jgi:hypothetical protein
MSDIKWYKVKPYQVYFEFYKDSNIAKRRFLENEIFSATSEQLNINQLDRLEEVEEPKQEKQDIDTDVKSEGTQKEDERSTSGTANAESDRKEIAAAKLRGKTTGNQNTELF